MSKQLSDTEKMQLQDWKNLQLQLMNHTSQELISDLENPAFSQQDFYNKYKSELKTISYGTNAGKQLKKERVFTLMRRARLGYKIDLGYDYQARQVKIQEREIKRREIYQQSKPEVSFRKTPVKTKEKTTKTKNTYSAIKPKSYQTNKNRSGVQRSQVKTQSAGLKINVLREIFKDKSGIKYLPKNSDIINLKRLKNASALKGGTHNSNDEVKIKVKFNFYDNKGNITIKDSWKTFTSGVNFSVSLEKLKDSAYKELSDYLSNLKGTKYENFTINQIDVEVIRDV